MDRLKLETVLERAKTHGFIGSDAINSVIDHAVFHLQAAQPARNSNWCDLGSGGGIPGLVVASEREDLTLTLIDRSTARVTFLQAAIEQLGISGRVQALCGDITELAHQSLLRHSYDGVFCRSFASPAITAECAAGLIKIGGLLAVSEPPDPRPDRWSQEALAQLGFTEQEIITGPPKFLLLKLSRFPSIEVPRKWKKLVKNPLF